MCDVDIVAIITICGSENEALMIAKSTQPQNPLWSARGGTDCLGQSYFQVYYVLPAFVDNEKSRLSWLRCISSNDPQRQKELK